MLIRTWVVSTSLLMLTAPAWGQSVALKLRATLKGHTDFLPCIAFSADGKTLAGGGRGFERETNLSWAEIQLWDGDTGKERLSFRDPGQGISCLAFSPDGKALVMGSESGAVRLWNATSGKRIASFDRPRQRIASVGFSPDGKMLAAASEHEAWLWHVARPKPIRSFRRSVAGYNAVLSPDLRTLASPCFQDMDLWDLATGKLRVSLPDHNGSAAFASFSRDGKMVAVVVWRDEDLERHASEVVLWDAATGKEKATFKGHGHFIRSATFSPDGRTLALVGADELLAPKFVKLLDVATGKVLGTLAPTQYKESSEFVAFRPDGKVLAVSHADGMVRLWDIVPAKGR